MLKRPCDVLTTGKHSQKSYSVTVLRALGADFWASVIPVMLRMFILVLARTVGGRTQRTGTVGAEDDRHDPATVLAQDHRQFAIVQIPEVDKTGAAGRHLGAVPAKGGEEEQTTVPV